VADKRPTKSQLRLARFTADEPEQERRGIFELFREVEPEQPDEDAPLAREPDDAA
jgi:hypothetical protein